MTDLVEVEAYFDKFTKERNKQANKEGKLVCLVWCGSSL